MKSWVKDRFINKRMLYTVCFMMLTAIEIIRGSNFVEMEIPTGVIRLTEVTGGLKAADLWYIVGNLTGMVMMVIVFSAYKLKAFVTVSNGIWTFICLGTMCYLPYYKEHTQATFHLWQTETAILNVWWLFLIIKHLLIKSIKTKKIGINWNIPAIVWALMTLCTLISVNEKKIWTVWYFLMFGVFFLTEYTQKDRENMWNGLLNGLIVSFILVQVAAFFLRPYDYGRYLGLHYNTNMAGLYYLIIYVVCLCKLHLLQTQNAKKRTKGFYLLLAGCTLSLQFMTMCRTAWIISIVATVFYGIFVMRKIWRATWKSMIIRGILLVLSMAITFVPVFMAARWIPAMMPLRVWYSEEWGNEDRVVMGESVYSEKYTDLDEFLESVFGRIALTFQSAQADNPFVLKVYAAESNIEYEQVEIVEPDWLKDPGLRYRLTIYKAYWDDLRWFGNENSKGYYKLGDIDYNSWHAQNVWLQLAYYYGIPAGALFVALTILLFVYSYKKMMKNKKNPYAIIPFFICLMYFGFGTMEVVWNLGQLSLFLIFFVNMPFENEPQLEEKS